MRIEVNEDRPNRSISCDIHLDGESDPREVRILRGGAVVAEIPCSGVHDAEVLQAQVAAARRLMHMPRVLWQTLRQIAGGSTTGSPDDGTPEQRAAIYCNGFVAGVRSEKVGKPQRQTWLQGYKDGQELLKFGAEFRAEALGSPDVAPK